MLSLVLVCLKDKVIFLNVLSSCNDCMKALIQAGISTIYIQGDRDWNKRDNRASKELIQESGIQIIEVK